MHADGCTCSTEVDKNLSSNVESCAHIVQKLCESGGGRPGLSVLTSILVSVDVKNY